MEKDESSWIERIEEEMDAGRYSPNEWESEFLDNVQGLQELTFNQRNALRRIFNKIDG
jgi:hypothetical protein